jgi:hypothetical protein
MRCLVATSAATPSTIANVYAHTAAKVLAATAALVTVEQQADKKKRILRPLYFGCEKQNGN